MPNPYFQFKQFIVYQNNCAMKVGTDGVLLGAWANVGESKRILDIGTGTGLLSLMVAQRSSAQILGIEIDGSAAQQATENVERSDWRDRIQIKNVSLQEFAAQTDERFDFVISNPPYFNGSLKADSKERTMARHTDTLSYEVLLKSASMLLTEEGFFAVVLPYSEKERFFSIASTHNLYTHRVVEVYPTPKSMPKRILAEFSRQKTDCEVKKLVIESAGRHQYSEEYVQLTKDYYLNM